MIKIRNDLKKWKLEIKQCEKEYLKENKYIYYNYYEEELEDYDSDEFNQIDDEDFDMLIDDEKSSRNLKYYYNNTNEIKMDRNRDNHKRKIRYKVLLGILFFLCLIYSIFDVICIHK